jgi:hypothetical protein
VVGGGGVGVSLCGISGGSSAFLKELKKPILKAKPKNMAQALVKSDKLKKTCLFNKRDGPTINPTGIKHVGH